jgi:hypothetical protein
MGEKKNVNVSEILEGFEKMPVLARLNYVSDVLCIRAVDGEGGDPDPTLIMLSNIVESSIRALRKVRGIETLTSAEPAP